MKRFQIHLEVHREISMYLRSPFPNTNVVSNSFLELVRKDVPTDAFWKDLYFLRSMPLFMVYLHENDHATNLYTKGGSDTVEIAVSVAQSEFENSLKELDFQDKILDLNENEMRGKCFSTVLE